MFPEQVVQISFIALAPGVAVAAAAAAAVVVVDCLFVAVVKVNDSFIKLFSFVTERSLPEWSSLRCHPLWVGSWIYTQILD
jgi:hypothetical protein